MRASFITALCAAALAVTACNRSASNADATFVSDRFTVYPDSVVEGVCVARALSPHELISTFPQGDTIRRLSIPQVKGMPAYSSGSPLADAVVNLALADLDSLPQRMPLVRAAMAVELSLAWLDPDRSMELLRGYVNDGRVQQGPGLYGGWPVVADGIAWASAAWQVYLASGNQWWLEEAYPVVAATLGHYEAVAIDAQTGLAGGMAPAAVPGALPPYPAWMTGADIAASASLGINAMLYKAYIVAADMAAALHLKDTPDRWRSRAAKLRDNVNTALWIPNMGVYGQYLYSQPYPLVSAVRDNLGQGMAMVYGIATPEMRRSVLERTEVMPLGVSALYPQLADSAAIPPSHSLVPAVWGYWAIAASQAGDVDMLYCNLYSLVRSAAMNLGNFPAYTLDPGDVPARLLRHSADPLSAASAIAAVYHGLLGMRMTPDSISFRPLVAPTPDNRRSVRSLRWRDALLDVTVTGSGSMIISFKVDSVDQAAHGIPATLKGHHDIEIVMANNTPADYRVNRHAVAGLPPTPTLIKDNRLRMSFSPYVDGDAYQVYLNGTMEEQVFDRHYTMMEPTGFMALSVQPVRGEEYIGYASAPAFFMPPGYLTVVPADSLAYTGTDLIADRRLARRFVETTESLRRRMTFTFDAPADGSYIMQVEYANGYADPLASSGLCAIRLVEVADSVCGTLVMPPVKRDDWTATALSNFVTLPLRRGPNRISIVYRAPATLNAHRTLNTALLRRALLYRL